VRREKPIRQQNGKMVIYRVPGARAAVRVRLVKDTVWLTQSQMADLFQTTPQNITIHLRSVYAQGELTQSSTCKEYLQVRRESGRQVQRLLKHYNLDAIISVGYRVNSRRGVQFRIWATRVLREHMLKGYTVNERRLKELRQAIHLVADIAGRKELGGDEAAMLLRVIADYSIALGMLDDYDHGRLKPLPRKRRKAIPIDYAEAMGIVERLKEQFGGSRLFGEERGHELRGTLAAVMQTFGGKDLYPSVEAKAAHLLYFLVKDHVFVDGNKRIAAALFLWFMQKNGLLHRPDGSQRIANNALVAMTLLIAESHPREKDLLCSVLVHLIDAGKAGSKGV
jgi:prophage maintenance system killer protein